MNLTAFIEIGGGEGHHLSPRECLVLGLVLIVVSVVWFVVVLTCRDWFRRRGTRWGEYGEGPLVSRFSYAAMGVFVLAFGIGLIANGYLAIMPRRVTGVMLFSCFGLLLIGLIYDTARQR